MSLLGLDLGITGAKAIVFDLEGRIMGQAYREYPLLHPQPGWAELDSIQVWEAAKECIREAVALACGADPVKALSVSCQGEAFTPVSKDRKVLGNAIVCLDQRNLAQHRWLEEHLGRERIFRITGMPLHPMYTLSKLVWLREHDPTTFSSTWKYLCYGDFALFMLGVEPAIDYSVAGRTMAFDVTRNEWSAELLELAGLSASHFAEAKPSGTAVGVVPREVAADLGLPEGVVACTGGHDQPCGALGAGIVREGIAMDATGTVECITPVLSKPVLSDQMLRNSYCCYSHVKRGMYITLAFTFTGGSLLRWYRDVLGHEEREAASRTGADVYGVILSKASSSPTGLLALPHFAGSGTPTFDAESKGAILGLTLETTKADLMQALLEGLTYEMKLNLERLDQAGVGIEELRPIGGGAKSEFWLQLKADVLERTVKSLHVSEAACLGAALLAGLGAGLYSSLDDAAQNVVRVKRSYEPDAQRSALYREVYDVYRDLYPAVASLLHRL